jgi:uncharacterized membrane protein (Fun14 family)
MIDTSFLSTVGFGGIVGFLIGFTLKKMMKILAVVAGIFLAVLIYLESQGIMTVNWEKLQSMSQGVLSAIANIVSTGQISSSTSYSAPIILPTTMTNVGIPLTGSAAMGFTIGFMKG